MIHFLKVPNQSIEPDALLVVESANNISYKTVIEKLSSRHPETVLFSLLENASQQAGPVAPVIVNAIKLNSYSTIEQSRIMYNVLSQKSINPYYVCVNVPTDEGNATVEIFNVRQIEHIVAIADLAARSSEIIMVAPNVCIN